ncbi:MAG: hypothetical protein IJL07_11335 [Lachnospiraceae bacterium]|nr:hypothetical protein [Lachnospiraceae bacterium]
MLEKLKQIPAKLLELWKKLTKRQKIITVSTVAGVLLMLLILIILLNRVQYEKLTTFDDTETAKTAIEVLDGENITNRLADDMVTVEVDVTRKKDAVLALTGNDMLEESAMTLAMLLDNDLSTTSTDKILKNHLYMQSSLGARIQQIDGVKKASVLYFPSDNSGGILLPAKEISCSVLLTLDSKVFDYRNSPEAIATYVAYAIGNTTTDKIKVLDTNGQLLFGGEEENEEILDLSANLAYINKSKDGTKTSFSSLPSRMTISMPRSFHRSTSTVTRNRFFTPSTSREKALSRVFTTSTPRSLRSLQA